MDLRQVLGGLVASGLVIGLSGCSMLGLGGTPTRDPEASVTESAVLSAFDLHVGDCLISADVAESFSEVPAVPCDEAHDSEIIYIFQITDTTFSQASIDLAGEEKCVQAMNDYIGPNYADVLPELDYTWFSPTAESFARGDREVDCLAYTVYADEVLTQSVKGLGT